MSRDLIRRAHDDPAWSGHLVEGADRGWRYEDCTFQHLATHLTKAAELVHILAYREHYSYHYDGHGVVSVARFLHTPIDPDRSGHTALAELFETVDNLQRYLPWIEGWCAVRYHRIEGERVADVLSAHLTRDAAEVWAEWWNPEKGGHRNKVGEERYGVKWMPAPILAFRHEDAVPGQHP